MWTELMLLATVSLIWTLLLYPNEPYAAHMSFFLVSYIGVCRWKSTME